LRSILRNSSPDPLEVKPYGARGGGLITGHPVGLLLVVGVLCIALTGLPEAWWFLAVALPLGAIVGLVLWLRHR
jgi:hypothetical protein